MKHSLRKLRGYLFYIRHHVHNKTKRRRLNDKKLIEKGESEYFDFIEWNLDEHTPGLFSGHNDDHREGT